MVPLGRQQEGIQGGNLGNVKGMRCGARGSRGSHEVRKEYPTRGHGCKLLSRDLAVGIWQAGPQKVMDAFGSLVDSPHDKAEAGGCLRYAFGLRVSAEAVSPPLSVEC